MSSVASLLSSIGSPRPTRNGPNGPRRLCISAAAGNKPREFFERFYANLFATASESRRCSRPGSMDKQKEMLNRALELLLKFDPACGCPELRRLAEAPQDVSADQGALRPVSRCARP